ncbi:MAG: polymer-forming cytoskeletal protein [Candidatus Aminicenantes bacterium]|nr:polymer-forming cytoskeletal protein [Candidatus Aminicenantes bacterium]
MIRKSSRDKKIQKNKDYSNQNSKNDSHSFTGIGSSLSIHGNVQGNEDLYIEGRVKGSIIIDNHTLTVGPNSKIEADLKAKNIIVQGHVIGNIHALEKVFIQEAAQVFGDIIAADISVMDGAHFEGNAKIKKSPQVAPPISAPTEKKSESRLLIEDEFIEE